MKISINENKFLKPLLQLTAGSAIAQIITILVSPISTRLFTSEQLGVYTLFLTVISIFGPVLNLKYDMSIVKARDDQESINLVALSTFLGLMMSIFISIGYSLYLHNESTMINNMGSLGYLLLPLLLIGTSVVNTLTSYNNLHKEYLLISKVYVIRNFVQNLFLVISGILRLGSIGLVFSQTISVFFGISAQSKKFRYQLKEKLELVKFSEMKKLFFSEKNQLIYLTPATLINTGSYSILNFFISSLFGLSVFGYYSMSYRILGLPLTLISGNVSRVYYEQAIEEQKTTGSYYTSLKKFIILLICISVPMVVFLFSFSPWIFSIFFGSDWYISGVYVRYLAPMYGVRLIVSSLSVSLIVSNKQKLELFLQSMFIFTSFIIFIVSKNVGLSANVFFTMISISYSCIYLFFLVVIIYYSRKKG